MIALGAAIRVDGRTHGSPDVECVWFMKVQLPSALLSKGYGWQCDESDLSDVVVNAQDPTHGVVICKKELSNSPVGGNKDTRADNARRAVIDELTRMVAARIGNNNYGQSRVYSDSVDITVIKPGVFVIRQPDDLGMLSALLQTGKQKKIKAITLHHSGVSPRRIAEHGLRGVQQWTTCWRGRYATFIGKEVAEARCNNQLYEGPTLQVFINYRSKLARSLWNGSSNRLVWSPNGNSWPEVVADLGYLLETCAAAMGVKSYGKVPGFKGLAKNVVEHQATVKKRIQESNWAPWGDSNKRHANIMKAKAQAVIDGIAKHGKRARRAKEETAVRMSLRKDLRLVPKRVKVPEPPSSKG